MIDRFFLGVAVGCLLILGWPLAPAHSVGELTLLRQETIQPFKQIDPDYFQERVLEDNPRYDGLVFISKSNRSLEFALLDENQTVLWRKPARSTWVTMAQGTSRLAMIGKMDGEGYGPGLGDAIFQGVDVLDFSGNLLFRLDDTGPIEQAFLSPQGELLLSTAEELRLYDQNGNLSWRSAPPPADAQFLGRGSYIKTFTWDPISDSFALQLIESLSGDILRVWQYNRSNEMAILMVDPDENRLLLSEFVGSSPPEWNLVLYRMAGWKPIASLKFLAAGPFSPAWNRQENGFGLLLRRPQIQSEDPPGEILLGFWDLDDGSLVTQSLGTIEINPNQDRLIYDAQSSSYHLRIDNTVYVYDHGE
jgi:hypothetical protein